MKTLHQGMLVIVLGWAIPALADTNCNALVPWGAPAIQNPGLLSSVIPICRTQYTLVFNPTTRTPVWVAEYITLKMITGHEPRSAKFFEDPALPPAARSHMKDYSHSGYDMGHMAPAGDFVGDAQQILESFYLSNIVPQVGKDFNRGVWMRLEQWVRKCVRQRGPLLVVTGPIYANGQPLEWIPKKDETASETKRTVRKAGYQRVAVPTHLFKVITDPRRMESVAFVMPNQAHPRKDYAEFAVPVNNVEAWTGLNFHPALTPAQAAPLESQTKVWNCK